MEKEFVPKELSTELKKLGFEESCIRGWDNIGNIWYHPDSEVTIDNPTYSQAFRFFREKYDLLNHITTHLNPYGEDGALEESYGYRIMINKDGWKCNVWEKLSFFDTYEEAELELLTELIKIVKNK